MTMRSITVRDSQFPIQFAVFDAGFAMQAFGRHLQEVMERMQFVGHSHEAHETNEAMASHFVEAMACKLVGDARLVYF